MPSAKLPPQKRDPNFSIRHVRSGLITRITTMPASMEKKPDRSCQQKLLLEANALARPDTLPISAQPPEQSVGVCGEASEGRCPQEITATPGGVGVTVRYYALGIVIVFGSSAPALATAEAATADRYGVSVAETWFSAMTHLPSRLRISRVLIPSRVFCERLRRKRLMSWAASGARISIQIS